MGFVDGTATKGKTSDMIYRISFIHFFIPNNLPRLMIVDYWSTFKVVVTAL